MLVARMSNVTGHTNCIEFSLRAEYITSRAEMHGTRMSIIADAMNSLSMDWEACEYRDHMTGWRDVVRNVFSWTSVLRPNENEGRPSIFDVSIMMSVQVDDEPWDRDSMSSFCSEFAVVSPTVILD